MHKSSFKALYVFLTALLGMILLLMLQRALFVIYDLLGVFFPAATVLQMDRLLLQSLDFGSLLFALFIGGWYGVYLGLHWYSMVYSEGNHNKLFHGFIPHPWRKSSRSESKSANGVPKKIVARAGITTESATFQTYRRKPASAHSWSFDELTPMTEAATEARKSVKRTVVRKVVTKKPAAKKVVRKTVTKKKVTEQVV